MLSPSFEVEHSIVKDSGTSNTPTVRNEVQENRQVAQPRRIGNRWKGQASLTARSGDIFGFVRAASSL